MHDDELEIGVGLVRRLLVRQQPQWSDLPLQPVPSSGTESALFRLGGEMVVRMPRIHWAVDAIDKEHRWLPILAPHLPLIVPMPLAKGEPGEGYPWPWSIYEWLHGEDALGGGIKDLSQAATDIGRFVAALQAIDTTDAPQAVPGGRGAPLHTVDEQTRKAITAARGLVDTGAVTAAWDAMLRVPGWGGPAVWFHGDIAGGNLLVRNGRVFAAIDFSGIGIGDPACDLAVAWELLDPDSRQVLRAALAVDDPTWERARGWALCTAMWALPYYLHSNPVMVTQARHKIDAVLKDMGYDSQ